MFPTVREYEVQWKGVSFIKFCAKASSIRNSHYKSMDGFAKRESTSLTELAVLK